ncbi:sodium:solute symporter family protein [uncultured Ilyobacter sp.]|uniref:sodium:solute symporter family protein n=1 Tax=uncultured Ilyobacter sp. TaxID=544433 RepID=UPI0029F589E0|nr:sodium:solute symporter family protein [uncultured Ilyobacter sp.]
MNDLLFYLYILGIFLVGIGSYKKIRGTKDFYVAGGNAGVLPLTGSLLATILGSSAIIGSVNFSTRNGWAGSWFMICAALGLGVLYFLLERLKTFKGYNLPELLGSFYGIEVNKIASFVIPIAWTGIVASQIMGAAMIISKMTSISYTGGIWLSGLVFIAYTCLGGQFSIIKTDFIQFLFIIFGLLICFIYTNLNYDLKEALPLINNKFGYKELVVMLLTYSTTFFVGPDIYSRIFCAKDIKTSKKAIVLSIIILLPLAYILSSLGIYASALIGDRLVDSSLIFLIEEFLPKSMAVLMYFCLLSAVISSADTTLLTASSMLTQIFIGDLKNMKSIAITRVFIVFLGIFSIYIAIKMQFILSSIFLAFSVYSGAFIIPTFLGILGYRVSKEYIISAIFAGGGLALFGKIYGGQSGNIYIISAFILNAFILYIPCICKKRKEETSC